MIKLSLKATVLRGPLGMRGPWVSVLSGPPFSLSVQVQVGTWLVKVVHSWNDATYFLRALCQHEMPPLPSRSGNCFLRDQLVA